MIENIEKYILHIMKCIRFHPVVLPIKCIIQYKYKS